MFNLKESLNSLKIARRPKTDAPDSSYLVITFRQSIFEHVNYFADLGIPSIIGALIGTSVEDIGFGSNALGFNCILEKKRIM